MRAIISALAVAGLFSIALPSYSADEPYTSESKAAKPGRAISEDVKSGNTNKPGRAISEDVKTGNSNKPGRAISEDVKPVAAPTSRPRHQRRRQER